MYRMLVVVVAIAACGKPTATHDVEPPIAIVGHVRDANGGSVRGAQVARLASVVEAHTVSDASGAYRFDVPRAGTWRVTAQAAGHVAAYVEGVNIDGVEAVDM